MTAQHQTATRPNQLRGIVLFVLGSLAVAIALHAFLWIGRANADPAHDALTDVHVPAISAPMTQASTDPITSAQAATATAWDTIATYGPLWGALLLTFGSIGAFLRANESKHWLAKGRALAYLTTGAMLLGAVLTWRFHGGDTAGLLMSVFLAIKMLISPTVASPPATVTPSLGTYGPDEKPPSPGRVANLGMLLALMLAGAALQPGCATVAKIPGAAKTAVIECGKADAPALVTVVAELGAQALLSVLKLGHIAWPEIEATAAAHGEKDGYCAALAFVRAMQAKQPATPGLLTAGPDPGDEMLDRLRARWPGVEWRGAVAP